MVERSADWYKQAKRDLELAKKVAADGFCEWACFAAHQSAEKAVKAILQKRGYDAWGHSLLKFCQELASTDLSANEWIDDAKKLDKLYIPTRYPNGFVIGAPMDYYTQDDSSQAIASALKILNWVEGRLNEN